MNDAVSLLDNHSMPCDGPAPPDLVEFVNLENIRDSGIAKSF